VARFGKNGNAYRILEEKHEKKRPRGRPVCRWENNNKLGRTEAVLSYGYIGARTDTTQQSGQTPDKVTEIKNINVSASGYTETDTTGMLSPPTVWRKQSKFVSSRQSGQILAAVLIGFEFRWNGQNSCQFKCSHTFLQCKPRQMLVYCVVSVPAAM
jgi:hypothetical protein